MTRLYVTVQLPLLLLAERADVDSRHVVDVFAEFQFDARPLGRQDQRQVLDRPHARAHTHITHTRNCHAIEEFRARTACGSGMRTYWTGRCILYADKEATGDLWECSLSYAHVSLSFISEANGDKDSEMGEKI